MLRGRLGVIPIAYLTATEVWSTCTEYCHWALLGSAKWISTLYPASNKNMEALNREETLLSTSRLRVSHAVQSNTCSINSARQNMQVHSGTHVITLEQGLAGEVHTVGRIQSRQKGHIVLQARQLK